MDFFDFTELFKDQTVFTDNYVPDKLFYREEQIRSIAQSMINPYANILLIGGTGTGKTNAIKFTQNLYEGDKRFKDEDGKPKRKILYLHCSNKTHRKIIDEIADFFGKSDNNDQVKNNDGKASKTIKDSEKWLKAQFNNGIEKPYVILDEFDKLGNSRFYELVKIFEGLGIFGAFITNNRVFPTRFPKEIATRLAWNVISFAKYTPDQLYTILEDRSQKGFVEGAVSESLLRYLSARATREDGDARLAVKTLSLAGMKANQAKKNKLTQADIEESIKHAKVVELLNAIQDYDESKKILLLLIGSKDYYSMELYTEYKRFCARYGYPPEVYQTFKRKVREMNDEGSLVDVSEKRGGQRGLTSRIRCISPEQFSLVSNELCKSLALMPKDIQKFTNTQTKLKE